MLIFVFVCSSKMVKNGKTKAGKQRYRCLECGSSPSRRYALQARDLKLFLDWLLGKQLYMKSVIAEKLSVAISIAKVIGANKKKDGYYEGNGIIEYFKWQGK